MGAASGKGTMASGRSLRQPEAGVGHQSRSATYSRFSLARGEQTGAVVAYRF
jgi:hypothetical protein